MKVMLAATLLMATAPAWAQSSTSKDAKDTPTQTTKQTVNGHYQTMHDTPRSDKESADKHWNDGLNTKDSIDPRKRDEYGTPRVTAPQGQGTNNRGGIPPRSNEPARSGTVLGTSAKDQDSGS
jgi:hypothetical protein